VVLGSRCPDGTGSGLGGRDGAVRAQHPALAVPARRGRHGVRGAGRGAARAAAPRPHGPCPASLRRLRGPQPAGGGGPSRAGAGDAAAPRARRTGSAGHRAARRAGARCGGVAAVRGAVAPAQQPAPVLRDPRAPGGA